MKNIIKSVCLTLVLVLSFSGCSTIEQIANYNLDRLYEESETVEKETKSLPESTYVKNNIELVMLNPESLNPLDKNEYDTDQVLKLIYEPVFVVNGTYELENGVIDSYEQTGDKIYRFKLKDKFFHNDEPLTSDDIKYSADYVLNNPDTPYGYVGELVESVSIIDEMTFDVRFKEINYYNLYALTFPIVSKNYVTSDEYDHKKPIGTGPYKYSDYQEMMYLKLTKNDNYDKEVRVENINISIVRTLNDEYNMFLSKRIDVHSPLNTVWTNYSDDRTIRHYLYDSPYYYYIGFNHKSETLQKAGYKELISSAVPYLEIKRDVFLNHLSMATMPVLTDHVFSTNMDLYYTGSTTVGYYGSLYNKNNISSYVSIITADDPMFRYNNQTLRLIYNSDDPYQVGIGDKLGQEGLLEQVSFELIGLSGEDYEAALNSGDYDMFIGNIKTSIIPELSALYKSGGSLNIGEFSSLNVDGLISSYYKVTKEDQFSKQLENLAKVMSDELPIIPLGYLENGLFIHDQVDGEANPSYFYQFYGFELFSVAE